MTHQGQIDGAIMQGVGYALMEQLASEEGHISTLSMGEVKTPTMQDMHELVTVLARHAEVESQGVRPSPTPSTMRWESVSKTCPSRRKKCSPRYSKGDPLRSRPA